MQAFEGDPLAAAAAFVRAGVTRLHVVDLDLAVEGAARNLGVIGALAGLGVPVQASGGAAIASEIDLLLDAGADRAVLGSAALVDPVRVGSLVEAPGRPARDGIEVDGGRRGARRATFHSSRPSGGSSARVRRGSS